MCHLPLKESKNPGRDVGCSLEILGQWCHPPSLTLSEVINGQEADRTEEMKREDKDESRGETRRGRVNMSAKRSEARWRGEEDVNDETDDEKNQRRPAGVAGYLPGPYQL